MAKGWLHQPLSHEPSAISHGQSVLCERVVDEAVDPALARLRRCDDGMADGARVVARVTVRRRVAAERDAAALTGAKVHPAGAYLDALLTLVPARLLDLLDLVDVRAAVRHDWLA